MPIPKNIQALMESECEKVPLRPTIRKGLLGHACEDPFCRLADCPNRDRKQQLKIETELIEAWNSFHEKVEYPNWECFYDKEAFCDKLSEISLTREQFMQVICDQSFLFPGYAEHYNDPNYYLLRDVLHQYDREISQNDPSRYKVDLVLDQGFVPTVGLNKEYRKFQERLKILQQAIEQRMADIERFDEINGFADISLQIAYAKKSTSVIDNDMDCSFPHRLEELFKAYVSHIVEHAYASDLKDNLKNQTAEQQQRCLAAIQHVLQWCEMHLVDTTRHALVIWALFTQETNKLLQGKLNKFTFQPKRKKIHDDAPWKIDGKLSARIGANIILFDHLLDLFSLSESDRRFAKYQFYVFTRYDRFTHYRTSIHQYLKFEACEEDGMDCVDHLGGIIRYMVEHCLMNTSAWLNRMPTLQQKELLNSLTSLLLHDATLMPTNRRLTDRIRLVLNDDEACMSMIVQYKQAKSRTDILRSIIQENNLHFRASHVFLDEEELQDPFVDQCEQMLLEFALKEKIFSDYYKNLYKKAAELFPAEWFLSDTVFTIDTE